MNFYILIDRRPVKVGRTEWFADKKEEGYRVARTKIGDDATVSTVFIGFDDRDCDATPLTFETMVLGGALDGEFAKYATWDEAERGHLVMAAKVRKSEFGG